MEKIVIPAGTQPGKVITLKRKGVPKLQRKDEFGDQRITVTVVIPRELTEDQRELMGAFGKTLGSEIQPQDRGFWDKLKDKFNG